MQCRVKDSILGIPHNFLASTKGKLETTWVRPTQPFSDDTNWIWRKLGCGRWPSHGHILLRLNCENCNWCMQLLVSLPTFDIHLATCIQQLYNNYTTTIQQPIQQPYNNCIFTVFRWHESFNNKKKVILIIFGAYCPKTTKYELLYSCCIGCCMVVV